MKKVHFLKAALGLGIFAATLTIDLGGAFGVINSSYAVVKKDDEKAVTASGTCPDGKTFSGILCIKGDSDCSPTVDCATEVE
jgi:hypothetical protein